jgi:hypothetical protein
MIDYFSIGHTVWWKLCDDLEKFTAIIFAVVFYIFLTFASPCIIIRFK